MKTIPFVPACQNMEEIQKLAVLITDFIHPEMIVLFGRYAGMPSYDIRGGYELLILTANQLAVGVKEVMGYLFSFTTILPKAIFCILFARREFYCIKTSLVS